MFLLSPAILAEDIPQERVSGDGLARAAPFLPPRNETATEPAETRLPGKSFRAVLRTCRLKCRNTPQNGAYTRHFGRSGAMKSFCQRTLTLSETAVSGQHPLPASLILIKRTGRQRGGHCLLAKTIHPLRSNSSTLLKQLQYRICPLVCLRQHSSSSLI